MTYCVDPSSDEPIMLINKHIGYDEVDGMGVDGALFQEELLALDAMGKKVVHVWINSVGGSVMDGYNIYTAILNSKCKVDTYVKGVAASIAAVIFQAGRNRIMADYGKLMYHNPFGSDDTEQLQVMKDSLVKMVASKSGKPESEVSAMMNRTTWLGAEEAKADGLCDSIEASSDFNKKRMVGDAKAMWIFGNGILNKAFEKIDDMQKITNKLNLVSGADEAQVLAAIESIENKAAASAAEVARLKNESETKQKEADELKNKLDAAEKSIADEKAAKEKAESEAKAAEIENVLNAFVKEGRIKNEAVSEWKETAGAVGIEKVKNMINALPIVKKAAGIENVKDANPELAATAAGKMAEVRAKMGL